MPQPELRAEIWVAAYRRQVEIMGANAHVARRGQPDAGAVVLKLVTLGAPRFEPNARALHRVSGAEGRRWAWLVGPDAALEADVDAKLRRAAAFDEDLWVVEVEDRDGRHFLDAPELG